MVGLLAGALGTGIGQAAGGVAEMAKGYIDDERKVDLQRQFADIEYEKQNRLDESRKARDYEYKIKEGDPDGQIVQNDLKSSNLKARQDATNAIDKINTPGFLQSAAALDRANSAGEIATKQTRSGDSIASEGSLGKLDPKTKSMVELYGNELKSINSAIVKAQADNTWDPNSANAASLLKRQAVINEKIGSLLNVGNGGGSGKSGSDFDPSLKKPDAPSTAASNTSLVQEEAPKMDTATRRVYTSQGKQAAIDHVNSQISNYERIQKEADEKDSAETYNKAMRNFRNQIRAVESLK